MTQDNHQASHASPGLNLTMPLLCVCGFLVFQLMQAGNQMHSLQQAQTTCQTRLERGDQMIDKLRGFNR